MRVELQTVAPAEIEADVLVLPLAEGEGPTGAATAIDGKLDGLIARLVQEGELRGDLGSARLVHLNGQLPAKRVALAGIGKVDQVDADSFRTAASAVAREARGYAESIAWAVDDSLPVAPEEQARAIVEGTLIGGYEPARWKHDEPKSKLSKLTLCADAALEETVERAGRIAVWVNRARDLVNSPPNEATPERLAARAAEVAGKLDHVETEALGPDEIRAQGMGALAAVAQG